MDNLQYIKNTKSLLGEAPLYNHNDFCFYWSDIKNKKLLQYNIKTEQINHFQFHKEIGSFCFTNENKIIASANDGFEYLNLKTLDSTPITDPEKHLKNNRFNDGKCDKLGRYFAGTMDNTEKTINGSLYCYDGKNVVKKIENLGISNGLGWNKEYTKFYLCDSMKGIIYQFDYCLDSATLSNKKVFVDVDEKDGYPDGLCIDEDGYIYSCHWDGSRITKYNSNGKIVDIVTLPVPRVTSCCFGGKNLDKLYITTASYGLTEEELKDSPLSGYVFTLDTKARGVKNNFFKG